MNTTLQNELNRIDAAIKRHLCPAPLSPRNPVARAFSVAYRDRLAYEDRISAQIAALREMGWTLTDTQGGWWGRYLYPHGADMSRIEWDGLAPGRMAVVTVRRDGMIWLDVNGYSGPMVEGMRYAPRDKSAERVIRFLGRISLDSE